MTGLLSIKKLLPIDIQKYILEFIVPTEESIVFATHTKYNMEVAFGEIATNLKNIPVKNKNLTIFRIINSQKKQRYRYYICLSFKKLICDCNGMNFCKNRHCDEICELRNISSYCYVGKNIIDALIILYHNDITILSSLKKNKCTIQTNLLHPKIV
jgi:hypothetical protein